VHAEHTHAHRTRRTRCTVGFLTERDADAADRRSIHLPTEHQQQEEERGGGRWEEDGDSNGGGNPSFHPVAPAEEAPIAPGPQKPPTNTVKPTLQFTYKYIYIQDCLRKLEYCDKVLYFL